MPRNAGSSVDTHTHEVRDRNGLTYPVSQLLVTEDGLYYTRPIDGNRLFWHQERWLVPRFNWVINRFAFHAHRTDAVDWYIETDMIDVTGDRWEVRDGYLDVYVHEGLRYELEDAGELAEAIVAGEIPLADAITALRSLDVLAESLRENGSSGHALLAKLAPSLPPSRLIRDAAGLFSLGD